MSQLPDYFVSICLAQEGDVAPELEAISDLAAFCSQHLQYWEIVFVAGEGHRSAIRAAIDTFATIKNLRIVLVRDAINYYRRRTIGASEAIGDVVILTSFNEMTDADLLGFAEEALARNRIVIGRSELGSGGLRSLPHRIVGLISQHRVDARDLKTIALPRNYLVAILTRPTAAINLRFEPKRGVVPYVRKELHFTSAAGETGLKQRLELLAEIISSSAARFLAVFALVSVLVSALAAAYGVYAVAVILLRDDVQVGWFSTAIAQSGSAVFFSLGLAVIALGIAHIIDRLNAGVHHEIVDEIGNISFYDRIHDLNVQIGSESRKADANDP